MEYRHDYTEVHQRTRPKFWDPRSYYLKELLRLIISSLPFLPKGSKLIDFGCGAMPYKSFFLSSVKEYKGADLEENPATDIIIRNGKADCDSGLFNVVLSTQVLEHVANPSAYLKECNRLLNDQGILILSTHGYWMYHPDPTDYWRWTSSGLRKIISESEFEIIHFSGIIGRAAMGLQLFQDGLMFKFPGILKPMFTSVMQLLIVFFDRLEKQKNKDLDACTYMVIARKK